MNDCVPASHPAPARRRWMAVLARAKAEQIAALLDACGDLPGYTIIRGPGGRPGHGARPSGAAAVRHSIWAR